MGSLTADLLTLHNESYVVRAQVQVDGVILATGLGAAPNIEAAEDRARLRALQALVPESANSPNANPPIGIRETIPDRATKVNGLIEPPLLATPQTEMPPAANHTANDTFGQPIAQLKSEPLKSEPREASIPSSEFANPRLSQSNPPNLPQSPVDLSDIIAQTDVELRRLGWTSAQGREYLEQTYGKRSRQQLSDEELLTFLLYLESQPGPIESQL